MNNRQLSWTRKYNNNHFIIASRAYFQQKGSLPSEPAQRIARTLPGETAHSRTACMPLGQPAHRTPLARLSFSQGQAAVRTAPPIAIKTKTRGVTWMVNRTHTIWIIQTFEILKWQLFFQNAFVGCYSSAPSLKMDTKNTTACRVPFHDSMPSFMNFRRVLDLLEFKNKVSQHFAGNQRCPGVWNSFPFLAWDLSMHPRTHIWFFQPIYMD